MPLNEIESLSRLAGSPALPTAITTRPQLASSPAIAVFTSGEFATDIAILRADAFDVAPSTMISTSLRAPSPSRATCSARSASSARKALVKAVRRGSLARLTFGAPLAAAAAVANASSVSDVDVSPSMVTALKVSSTPLCSSDCNAPAAIGASVNTNASMVAMSGAIMPAPLAMPLMMTFALPSFTVAVATFGKVSVVMMAFAASIHSPGAAFSASVPSTPLNLVASSGSPITPVDARNTSLGLHPSALAAIEAVSGVACRPVLPVKALALPEFTTSARANPPLEDLPPLSLARHHSTGADGHFDWVKTPATVVPLSMTASSTSVGASGETGVDIGKNPKTSGSNRSSRPGRSAKRVFAQIVPAIHVFSTYQQGFKTWMPGTSPGMTPNY